MKIYMMNNNVVTESKLSKFHLEKQRRKWLIIGMMQDTIATPVAPVTTTIFPDWLGQVVAKARLNPKMTTITPTWRNRLFWIHSCGIHLSIVCLVGNSSMGRAIAKYTAEKSKKCLSSFFGMSSCSQVTTQTPIRGQSLIC